MVREKLITIHKTRKFQETKQECKEWIGTDRIINQASFSQKSKLIEGTWYWCGKPELIFPYSPEAESNPKDKWEFKTATQNICAESQKSKSQSGNKNHNKIKTNK